ncbi:hypothetical protein FRB99_003446 [Tulasnella sp. 403]|nr:hypothetical protein FRB99_003446 [Tulasnella sp. 403]
MASLPSSSSSSLTPKGPPIPLRSALRPKTSASTIGRDKSSDLVFSSTTAPPTPPSASSSSMATILPERPNSSPSPRQSYFEKYPRPSKSREKINGLSGVNGHAQADSVATARAKAARERVKALNSRRESEKAESSSSQRIAYAFPTVDSSPDEHEASTSSDPPIPSRRVRQLSATSSSRQRSRLHGHRSNPSAEAKFNNPPIPSRPPREVPRGHAHNQLAALSHSPYAATDLPFNRTSTSSSSYTQTTLADQDHEFTPLSTPKSSIYRSDGVMVAAPTCGIGVETMDALVHQMNGGTDAPDDADYLSNIFGKRLSKKERRNTLGTNGFLGGKMKYHPLYHPPLPVPPNGISLGTPKARSSSRKNSITEEDRSTSASATASAVSSSEREKDEVREKTSRKSSAATSSYRPGSSKSNSARSVTEAVDEGQFSHRRGVNRPSSRDRDRTRHRHKERVRSREQPYPSSTVRSSSTPPSSRDATATPSTVDLTEKLEPLPPAQSIEDIIRKNLPVVEGKKSSIPPSISDIIRTHAPVHARPKRGPPPSSYSGVSAPTIPAASSAVSSNSRISEEEEEEMTGRSSMDSIAAEIQDTLRKTSSRFGTVYSQGSGSIGRQSSEEPEDRVVTVSSPTATRPHRPPRPNQRSLQHTKSYGDLGDHPRGGVTSEPPTAMYLPYGQGFQPSKSPRSEGGHPPTDNGGRAVSVYSGPAPSIAPSTPLSFGTPMQGFTFSAVGTQHQDPSKIELAQFLRSPRLTRLLTLRRHPHAGLTVSMADVGSPTGHPVIVYLGLGCVRYLIALYDEMAEALNLRLVCVDRWGLGRTGEPKNPNGRGLLEWAAIIEEVADTLGIEMYSVVAHSAGAPYALAGVLKCGDRRVRGSVHLLAPWVSTSVDTSYKWLRYVPNGLIKTAQAAEWKVQGWMLGKPPTITYQPIGFDASASATDQQKDKQQPEQQQPATALSAELALPSSGPSGDLRSSLSTSDYDDLADFNGKYGSSSTLGALSSTLPQEMARSKKKPVRSILSLFNNNATGTPSSNSSQSKDSSTRSSRANSVTSSGARTLPAKSPKLKGLKSLSSLRNDAASGTADLLAILERDSKPWGFSYADIRHPVKVWYGDRDEKIAISSVRWMERVMKDCTVKVVKGGTHNLMTNADIVVEVLESVAKEWGEDAPISPGMYVPSPGLMSSSSSLYRRKGRA